MKLTNEQLAALPELADYKVRTMLPRTIDRRINKRLHNVARRREQIGRIGDQVRERIVHKFVAYPVGGDDVVTFVDQAGVRWLVEYCYEGGPHKRRFSYP